jgi:hypothetical protein
VIRTRVFLLIGFNVIFIVGLKGNVAGDLVGLLLIIVVSVAGGTGGEGHLGELGSVKTVSSARDVELGEIITSHHKLIVTSGGGLKEAGDLCNEVIAVALLGATLESLDDSGSDGGGTVIDLGDQGLTREDLSLQTSVVTLSGDIGVGSGLELTDDLD